MYQVSNLGRVKSFLENKEKILRNRNDGIGYLRVALYKRGVRKDHKVHRLVLFSFKENPLNKPHVNHINSNRSDNRVENLEWCTQSENVKHAFRYGNLKPLAGEKNNKAKLSNSEVLTIRILYQTESSYSIAKKYDVYPTTIMDIIRGKTWKHI